MGFFYYHSHKFISVSILKRLLLLSLIIPLLFLFTPKNKDLPSPIFGKVTSGFENRVNPITGKKEFHNATDVAAPCGTPIISVTDCEVVGVGEDNIFGKNVTTKHGDTLYRYCHLSATNLINGWKLKKGEIIGYVGATGYATGAHLHIEVIKNGEYINPETVMDFK